MQKHDERHQVDRDAYSDFTKRKCRNLTGRSLRTYICPLFHSGNGVSGSADSCDGSRGIGITAGDDSNIIGGRSRDCAGFPTGTTGKRKVSS